MIMQSRTRRKYMEDLESKLDALELQVKKIEDNSTNMLSLLDNIFMHHFSSVDMDLKNMASSSQGDNRDIFIEKLKESQEYIERTLSSSLIIPLDINKLLLYQGEKYKKIENLVKSGTSLKKVCV